MVLASTSASPGSGMRIAISPETVVSRTSAPPRGSRSSTMLPLTDSALTAAPLPSITVRSPETVLTFRSPDTACASTLPLTVSAVVGPVSPTSAISPFTPAPAYGP